MFLESTGREYQETLVPTGKQSIRVIRSVWDERQKDFLHVRKF